VTFAVRADVVPKEVGVLLVLKALGGKLNGNLDVAVADG
jgi:hypothetical protein